MTTKQNITTNLDSPPRPWHSLRTGQLVDDGDIISEAATIHGEAGQAAKPLTSARAKRLGIASGKARRKYRREKLKAAKASSRKD